MLTRLIFVVGACIVLSACGPTDSDVERLVRINAIRTVNQESVTNSECNRANDAFDWRTPIYKCTYQTTKNGPFQFITLQKDSSGNWSTPGKSPKIQ